MTFTNPYYYKCYIRGCCGGVLAFVELVRRYWRDRIHGRSLRTGSVFLLSRRAPSHSLR